jgi:hypothetical protein
MDFIHVLVFKIMFIVAPANLKKQNQFNLFYPEELQGTNAHQKGAVLSPGLICSKTDKKYLCNFGQSCKLALAISYTENIRN